MKKKDKSCQCHLCFTLSPSHDKIRAALPGELKPRFDEIMNEFISFGEDTAYYHAILDGSWPSAVEHLERALEEAKKIRKSRDK